MRQNWQLLVMLACLMLMSAGTAAGAVLFITQRETSSLSRNQQASCERGNILRRAITANTRANRDGWEIARQARLMAAHAATKREVVELNTAAAEGYRGVIKRLQGIPDVDCLNAVR